MQINYVIHFHTDLTFSEPEKSKYELVGMRSRGKTHPLVETPTISNVQQQYAVRQCGSDGFVDGWLV